MKYESTSITAAVMIVMALIVAAAWGPFHALLSHFETALSVVGK
jgi:hypothetical protein